MSTGLLRVERPRIITTPPGPEGETKMSLPVRAHSFESAQCIWSRAAKHAKVLGRVSSLEAGGEPCVGVECSHERCSNMTSMYKVVKTVTSTKHRHEPFTDFYQVYEEIGSGEFAVVHRVIEKSTRTEYAAKYIKKKRVESSRRGVAMRDIEKEIHILAEMEHDNIIYLHQVYENEQYVILIIELLRGGELFDFIAERERLTEEEASFFIKQILLGVQHLHSHNVAHLDLKPENVMLLNNTCRTVKLIDFGLSRKILPGTEVREMLGTPEFVSPEVVNYEPLSLNTDLWSIGVITYIMLSGLSPFLGDTQQQTYENIVAVDFTFDEEGFENSSDLAKDFIQKLLVKEPRRRGSVWECLNHPWIFPRIPDDILLRQSNEINMDNLRNYQARKRWKHSMKVVFLCNRLSRTKLRGSWQALLEAAGPGAGASEETNPGGEAGTSANTVKGDLEDDNFVLSAIFCAIEEDNKGGLVELLSVANIDVNQSNKHGESGVHIAAGLGRLEMLKVLLSHGANLGAVDSAGDSGVSWAARQGHSGVLQFLVEHGVHVNQQNKLGEACLHTGCKYGHTNVIQYLVSIHTNLDIQDNHQESGLHIAAWHGFPRIVEILCEAGASLHLNNEEQETALHVAAARGHIECMRCLLDSQDGQAVIDSQDRRGSTPLHLALRRNHGHVALLLLHSGADFDLLDSEGETAIHICARDGQLGLAQTLCAFGCNVDIANAEGQHPLHLAAKHGNTEVARCLCLAGASIDTANREGVPPEVCARVQGHAALGDLLSMLKRDGGTEEYIEQLIPTTSPINKIKIKLFGHSGVGKTTLIESLKAGYFTSLFRRSLSKKSGGGGYQQKGYEHSGSGVRGNEEDREEGAGTDIKTKVGISREGSWYSHINQPTRENETSIGGEPSAISSEDPAKSFSSLGFYPTHENYTKGIDVQQTTISGLGDCSIWEFSGNDNYYLLYDHFIGNVNCIHVVLFNLTDSQAVQLQQIYFWLSFLQSRIPPVEPLGDRGRSHKPAYVVLVGTHSDRLRAATPSEDIRQKVGEKFGNIFNIEKTTLCLDSHAAGSQEMKTLKNILQQKKQQLIEGQDARACNVIAENDSLAHCMPSNYSLLTQREADHQGLPRVTVFLEQVSHSLPDWAQSLQPFPTVTWTQFVDYLHLVVNPLAGEEHLKEVIQQLQLMGEVVYLKCEEVDLIVLQPKWLCSALCGFLLSPEFKKSGRLPAVLTKEEFQLTCPEFEAKDVLLVLSALGLCTERSEISSQESFEFPCFISDSGETLPDWERDEEKFAEYGGVVLRAASPASCPALLEIMWPRVQVQLRRSLAVRYGGEARLVQTRAATSLSCSGLEGLVESEESEIRVRVRGPPRHKEETFFFLEEILGMVDHVLLEMSPGLPVDKLLVSSEDQRAGQPAQQWRPGQVMRVLMEEGWHGSLPDSSQSVLSLLCLGSEALAARLVPGHLLHVSSMSTVTRQALCQLLDPPHNMGKDWCMLAVQMGLSHKVPKLDVGAGSYSQTARLLDEWATDTSSTIGELIRALHSLGREDAAETLLNGCSLYRIGSSQTEDLTGIGQPAAT